MISNRPAHRPTLMIILSLTLVTLAIGCRAEPAESTSTARDPNAPPNIVVVLIDDLGWADLGCYGQTFHESPRIDSLASEGIRFTDAYAAAPVCSPTRASLMSGQYPARLGLTDFIPGHWRPFAKLNDPDTIPALPLNRLTIPERLQQAGYVSGHFGKWHLGNQGFLPDAQGFDEFVVTSGAHLFPRYRTKPQTEALDQEYLADFLTRQAIDFMERNADSPFFVHLSHYAVHIPLQAETDLIAKYTSKVPADSRVNHPTYAAMIEHVDRSVGAVLDTLERLELADSTVVMVLSDNGGLYRRFDDRGPAVTSNAPLRDEKGSLYEGGIRIPWIVRWPGVVEPGTTSEVPISTIDLLPTALEIARLSPDNGYGVGTIDGSSLVPLLQGNEAPQRPFLAWHYPHYHHTSPVSAIRAGSLKLLEYLETGKTELYDLEADLGETRNLAYERPEQAQRLRDQLHDWREQLKARMPVPNPEYDPTRAGLWAPRRDKPRR